MLFKLQVAITALLFLSCTKMVQEISKSDPQFLVDNPSKPLTIIFSHNINGETHPCGCRHFPLGGIPQVAGAIEHERKSSDVLYIDTGDTFFLSSKIPGSLKKSAIFVADYLANLMGQLDLKYYVPGDQDFAAGLPFLQQIASEYRYTFLLANLQKGVELKHKKWQKITRKGHRIYLTGVVDPSLLLPAHRSYFSDPVPALAGVFKEMAEDGYDRNNPFHRLILLSHSGVDEDQLLAQRFPTLDWIIGAHSQSFYRYPNKVGEVKLVQALSRNHYLGKITIDHRASRDQDRYEIIEVRDELSRHLTPNPYEQALSRHKSELKEIQIKEQGEWGKSLGQVYRHADAKSCLECHVPQFKQWQRSPHAIAYLSLLKVNEEKNLGCIKCHALGAGTAFGFDRASDMILKAGAPMGKGYWQALEKFVPAKPVRSLSPSRRLKLAKKWEGLDQRFKVDSNLANVQCLNCHDLDPDHPFNVAPEQDERSEKIKYQERRAKLKKRCLGCHTADQSPKWYQQDKKGKTVGVKPEKFMQQYHQLSCPAHIAE
jgi:hypothetical protein